MSVGGKWCLGGILLCNFAQQAGLCVCIAFLPSCNALLGGLRLALRELVAEVHYAGLPCVQACLMTWRQLAWSAWTATAWTTRWCGWGTQCLRASATSVAWSVVSNADTRLSLFVGGGVSAGLCSLCQAGGWAGARLAGCIAAIRMLTALLCLPPSSCCRCPRSAQGVS